MRVIVNLPPVGSMGTKPAKVRAGEGLLPLPSFQDF